MVQYMNWGSSPDIIITSAIESNSLLREGISFRIVFIALLSRVGSCRREVSLPLEICNASRLVSNHIYGST